MRTVEDELKEVNKALERHIKNFSLENEEECAQDIIIILRTFTEHCAMYIEHGGSYKTDNYYKDGIKKLFSNKINRQNCRYLELYDLHGLLQKVASHYVPAPEGCARLMRKYIDYLFTIKK